MHAKVWYVTGASQGLGLTLVKKLLESGYCVAAFSEVLALDVKEFGIRVTVVEPSGFRTGFLTDHSLTNTPVGIAGYEAVKTAQDRYLAGDGKQPGDPEKAAAILIGLAEAGEPPLHLYLGQDAYNRASVKLAAMVGELEQWKATTISGDFVDQR
jgi:NAD(P)-dependent dehydrogenase (short-subunit alcohol dehydrogenase family)